MKFQKRISFLYLSFALIGLSACYKGPYNPYLDLKSKDKPSVIISKDNNEVMKEGNKNYKKHMRRSKRKVQRRINRSLKGKS